MGDTTGCVIYFCVSYPRKRFSRPKLVGMGPARSLDRPEPFVSPSLCSLFRGQSIIYCLRRDDRDRYLHNTVTAAYA